MALASFKPCRYVDPDFGRVITCRNWDDCAGHAWYAPKDIIYCRHQVCWIIKEFLEYAAGSISAARTDWPSEGRETGYRNAPAVRKTISYRAPYELVLQIAGEVAARVKEAGHDGRLLMLELLSGQVDLSREARNALAYCSGQKRKAMTYEAWLKQRELRDAMRRVAANLYIR